MSSGTSDWSRAVAAVLLLTAWRVALLPFHGGELNTDEAQYWVWSQSLDFGYFSKPPMIAWIGRAVTELAGSSAPFWVRLPAPLLHMGTALVLMLTARRLFGVRVAVWTGPIYATLPFATLGSAVFSTDTVLLIFFSAALYFYVRLTEAPNLRVAVLFGLATGAGLLSKYAMIYLPLCIALAAALTPRARIAWRDAGIAAAVAAALLSPNVIWNLRNGAATVRHTIDDNANWDDAGPSLARGLEFLATQFGVFGPVLFAVLLAAGAAALARRARVEIAWLSLLSLPIVALMVVQAIRAQAHANWAVTAYVAGTILVAAVLIPARPRLARISLGLHGAIALAFPVLIVFLADLNGPGGNPLAKRYVGRAATVSDIAAFADAAGARVIVSGDRSLLGDLNYYLRDTGVRIYAVPPRGAPGHYYQQETALPEGYSESAVFVDYYSSLPCDPALAGPKQVLPRRRGLYQAREIGVYLPDPTCWAAN